MDAETRRLGHGPQEGDRRSLAVGASDVDHWSQPVLRPAQGVQEAFDPACREIDQRGMQGAQALDRTVGGADGVVVGGRRAQAATRRERPSIKVRRIEASTTGRS